MLHDKDVNHLSKCSDGSTPTRVVICGEEYEVTLIKKKVCNKWEPKLTQEQYNRYYLVTTSGDVIRGVDTGGELDNEHRQFGNYFQTEREANEASAQIRMILRLRAYVREFAPDWKADWKDENQEKWYVYYDRACNKWLASFYYVMDRATIYMPEHVAFELASKLNSGEVVL